MMLLAAMLIPAISAGALERAPDLIAIEAAALRAVPAPAVPAAAPADQITDLHLLLQSGRDGLVGTADTEELFRAAVAYWTPILNAAGVQIGRPTYAERVFTIPCSAPGGLTVRSFIAEPRQFPPKDEAGLRANMAAIHAAAEAAGLKPFGEKLISNEAFLPTYQMLYLTRPNAEPDHETRIRVLGPGDDMDMSVWRRNGVNIIQQGANSLMVYTGPQLGYLALAARDEDGAHQRLESRRQFLLENGKRILEARVIPLDDAEFKFAAELYFLQ